LLSRAEHLAARRLTAALEPEGCSLEQWRALAFLADGAGRTMTELAEYALLPAPTATKLIDRMVADSLVYRHPDPADRRRVLVYLTERGTELHQRAAAIVHEVAVSLGDDGTLAAQLARLGDALEPAAHRIPAPSPAPASTPTAG
jgi:DNA-binding MarR family transcriptional regulator